MRLQTGTPEEVGMLAQKVRRVAELAEAWVRDGITSALAVLVARRGVIVLHEAFGRLTPELAELPGGGPSARPDALSLPRDMLFPLASLTKPITATAVMTLVEAGLLGLNRPVSWYLPEFVGEGKEKVMVYHLLTHTSGLREDDVKAHAEEKKAAVAIPPPEGGLHPSLQEYLFLRCDAPLCKPPGTEMSYCDTGYNLLAEIVRRVSGRPLEVFARERIFEPLGMVDTDYIVPEPSRHRVVKRPADAFDADWLQMYRRHEAAWGDGSVFSTVMDMAVFGQMFLNRGVYGDARILSPPTVAQMTRNQIPGVGARYGDEVFPEASWGLGWDVQGEKKAFYGTLTSPRTFSHGGGGGVFLWVDPVYEVVGVRFSVSLWLIPEQQVKFCLDLFVNAVMAAIVEPDPR